MREETAQLQASEKHFFELESERMQTEAGCKAERIRTQFRARLAEERFKLETVENLGEKELEMARDEVFRTAQKKFIKQKQDILENKPSLDQLQIEALKISEARKTELMHRMDLEH
jgi:hypothetical protein